MSTLTADPYYLTFNQLILVKARSNNYFNYGPDSVVNIEGARVMQVPS
jgi:hypothetical protein